MSADINANTDQPAAPVPSDARSAGNVLWRVLPYLWPKDKPWVKWRVTLAMVMLLISKLIAVATPFLYKAAVDDLSGETSDPVFMLAMGAIGLTIAYGVARLMTTGFQQLRDVAFAAVGQRALREIALQTFNHIHRLSMRYHISRKTGGLSRIIERGVKGVEFLLRYVLFSIGPLILELSLIGIILATVFDVNYLLIVSAAIVLYTWFTFTVTEWRVKIRKQMNDQDTDANQKAIDSLLNFETVKYFGAEKWEADRYDKAMAGYEVAALRTSYSLAFLNIGQAFLITAGLVAVMVLAAIGVQNGTLTVGDFVLINAYMIQITMPLNFLGTVYREIRQALVDMGEMFDLLEQPSEVADAPNAKDIQIDGGEIDLQGITFGYEEDRRILNNVSLKVGAGEHVAIVGASGSGKSTIGRLLFRFYDTGSGDIKIDGQNVSNVTLESLHQAIGVVPQDTVLFNDTILYNIAYGRVDASADEIIEAAKAAKIHDFIMSLPNGYDTMVGERGLKLSGGEKQRVGIARTLLKNPPILLLDEATSALDTETEADIQQSLYDMGQGRTTISIAHRLSTIAEADRIVVLEKGQIAEIGDHETLLKREGRYAALWHLQQAEEAA